jgi:hypothetical protein
MKIVGVEMMLPSKIQRLAASEFLPQLPQDEFLLCVRYADYPRKCAKSRATEIHFLTPTNTSERG